MGRNTTKSKWRKDRVLEMIEAGNGVSAGEMRKATKISANHISAILLNEIVMGRVMHVRSKRGARSATLYYKGPLWDGGAREVIEGRAAKAIEIKPKPEPKPEPEKCSKLVDVKTPEGGCGGYCCLDKGHDGRHGIIVGYMNDSLVMEGEYGEVVKR